MRPRADAAKAGPVGMLIATRHYRNTEAVRERDPISEEAILSEGLITIAYGPTKYIRMARALALSYRRQNQLRPIAIVTDDSNTKDLENYFDVVIPLNPSYGVGVVQKLNLDHYSPFDETLFVDSDCLFYKSPERIWRLYASKDFTVRGWRYLTGWTEYEKKSPYEFVRNTPDFLRQNNIRRLPHFNSGVFFFRKSETASNVFINARSVYEQRATLGLVPFKNAPIADEPAFAAAMEISGVAMDPWANKEGMETAINMENAFSLNVLTGNAKFRKNGIDCDPVLIHFNVDAQNGRTYNREVCRLEFENYWLGPLYVEIALTIRFWSSVMERTKRFFIRMPERWRERGLVGILPNYFIKSYSTLHRAILRKPR
jgi:hypothetical protein